MRTAKKLLAMAAVWMTMSGGAYGYYFFVHYLSRTGPFVPIPEKFDLEALHSKTVPLLISEPRSLGLTSNDSFQSLVSQIRLAAKAWNDVPSSDLRLSFGGFFTPGTTYSQPVIEVVFEDLPPGLLAQGGPTLRADLATRGNNQFVPILRSTVRLSLDHTQRPSYSEGSFLTITHEIGHALGLQHSMTSSVMSTDVTRATTKSQPLAADDVAGISLLYPTPGYLATTGSIAGRVLLGSGGVHLASVVALAPDGLAISAVSNPDGTYRIEGLPPGSYFVYAHPLPPAYNGETFPANIIPPVDPSNNFLPSTVSFETIFYPGVKEMSQAMVVSVQAGVTAEGIGFGVTRRTVPAVYAVTTYSFPGQVAVKPAHLNSSGGTNSIVAFGVGLNSRADVSVIGGSAVIPQGGVKAYSPDPRFVQMDMQFTPFSGEGARHLAIKADNDVYVLPAGFRITRRTPPAVTSVVRYFPDAAGNAQLVVSGSGFAPDTRLFFDGVPATVVAMDDAAGTMVVRAPLAGSRHKAAVVALNRDGQSSLFLQGSNPAFYEFDQVEQGSVVFSPSQLPAGSDAMVEILGSGTSFRAGTTLAMGSADVHIRRVWVLGPNRILANVVVGTGATSGVLNPVLLNELRLLPAPGGFQITPANPALSRFIGPVVDATTGYQDLQVGAVASVRVTGAAAELTASSLQVSVNDKPAAVVSFAGGLLRFRVPADLSPGPAVLRMIANGDSAPPLVMSIDLPPPVVGAIQVSSVRVDGKRPARAGEVLSVIVSRLGEAESYDPASISILVGEVRHPAVSVAAGPNGSHTIQFVLDAAVGAGNHPLSVRIQQRTSAPVTLAVQ